MFTLLDEEKARKFWEEEIRQEGEEKLGRMINQLMMAGRNDDALRATTDEAYRKKLYADLGIE